MHFYIAITSAHKLYISKMYLTINHVVVVVVLFELDIFIIIRGGTNYFPSISN